MRYLVISLCLVLTVFTASAVETSEDVQQKIRTLLKNTAILDVSESPIPGLKQVLLSGNRIVYFHEPTNHLVFGEIFTTSGESLTAAAIAKAQLRVIGNLPLDQALVIGPENGVQVIEFTDPDCPYCHKLQNYFAAADIPVRRIIFFETRIHPDTAPQKAVHILCSEDPAAAFNDLYSARITPAQWLDCADGRERLARHQNISKQVGVKGTPTLLLDGKLVTGYHENAIAGFLQQKGQLAVAPAENQPEN